MCCKWIVAIQKKKRMLRILIWPWRVSIGTTRSRNKMGISQITEEHIYIWIKLKSCVQVYMRYKPSAFHNLFRYTLFGRYTQWCMPHHIPTLYYLFQILYKIRSLRNLRRYRENCILVELEPRLHVVCESYVVSKLSVAFL